MPDSQLIDKILYTPTEAAQALGISRSTIYVLMANGDVPSIRIGSSRRIPVEALRAYVVALARKETPPMTLGPGQAQTRLWS